MTKMTLGILAQKIDNVHSSLREVKDDLKECKMDIKENTSFRLQIRGMIAAFVMVGSTISGVTVWLLGRFFPK
jgi:TATA-box binding protein (TBP) (component of TFIID and TFIIIB)